MRFEGKAALVTGGNSGIGRAIVERFLREGAQVAFIGRDAEKGRATEAALAALGPLRFLPTDLAEERHAARAVARAAEWAGRLDLVVNNAGVGSRRCGVERNDSPGARLEKLLGPNLRAPYFVAAYALPHLKAAGGGAIVNISSTAALHGTWGSYGVAKAGVEALTRSLAVEGAPHRIRANGVSPGWIRTGVTSRGAPEPWEKEASLLGRMGVAAEIAAAVVFLASDEASFVTGATLIVDGGLTVTDYPSAPFLDEVGAWRLFSGALEDDG